jgi:hypothetical protein
VFVEKYFGLPCNMAQDAIIPGADFSQLVNLLVMFRDEQLAAAEETQSGYPADSDQTLFNFLHDHGFTPEQKIAELKKRLPF